jgi:hypothetical protein
MTYLPGLHSKLNDAIQAIPTAHYATLGGTAIATTDSEWFLYADMASLDEPAVATGIIARATHNLQPRPPLVGVVANQQVVAVSGQGDLVVYAGAPNVLAALQLLPADASVLSLLAQAEVRQTDARDAHCILHLAGRGCQQM